MGKTWPVTGTGLLPIQIPLHKRILCAASRNTVHNSLQLFILQPSSPLLWEALCNNCARWGYKSFPPSVPPPGTPPTCNLCSRTSPLARQRFCQLCIMIGRLSQSHPASQKRFCNSYPISLCPLCRGSTTWGSWQRTCTVRANSKMEVWDGVDQEPAGGEKVYREPLARGGLPADKLPLVMTAMVCRWKVLTSATIRALKTLEE